MDHFAEYLVQKRPTSQDRLKQGLIVAAAVVLSVLIGAISVLTGWLFLLVLVIGAIYGAYYLLTGCYTEYEYTVTNGELDVDKIAGRRKRSHLLTVPVSKFTGFGVYTDQTDDPSDAMDIMKAEMEEKPGDFAKVMDFHYDQMKLALESYRKVVRKVVDAESMENRKKDKSTNAVLSILRTMNRALNAVDAEKTVAQIKKLEQIVELGVFTGLNSSINSFNRQVKKQKPSSEELIAQIIDKIDELFERYNIPLDTDEERNEEILEPQIVVSESFI